MSTLTTQEQAAPGTPSANMVVVYPKSDGNIYSKDDTGVESRLSYLFSPITSSLGADVNLSTAAQYFDGPSIAQGTAGTWFVTGTVTVTDTANAQFYGKLWDGTTIIDTAISTLTNANQPQSIALSGYIAAPAGNLRISVRDPTTTNGVIKFNATGNSKDSTITAIRIA